MANKQEQFLNGLNELKELSRLQGHQITREQADEFIASNALTKEQSAFFYQYLQENKIGIDEVVEAQLEEEDVSYLDVYLEELRQLPSYSDSEVRAISMGAMAGDTGDIQKLVEYYLPYVADVAKLYTGQGVYIEDLIGEGNVALSEGVLLLAALEDIDEIQGFLGKRIMEAMEERIDEDALERKAEEKTLNKVNKVAEKAKAMSEELRRAVTVEELMEETGISEKEIRLALRMSGNQIEDIEG